MPRGRPVKHARIYTKKRKPSVTPHYRPLKRTKQEIEAECQIRRTPRVGLLHEEKRQHGNHTPVLQPRTRSTPLPVKYIDQKVPPPTPKLPSERGHIAHITAIAQLMAERCAQCPTPQRRIIQNRFTHAIKEASISGNTAAVPSIKCKRPAPTRALPSRLNIHQYMGQPRIQKQQLQLQHPKQINPADVVQRLLDTPRTCPTPSSAKVNMTPRKPDEHGCCLPQQTAIICATPAFRKKSKYIIFDPEVCAIDTFMAKFELRPEFEARPISIVKTLTNHRSISQTNIQQQVLDGLRPMVQYIETSKSRFEGAVLKTNGKLFYEITKRHARITNKRRALTTKCKEKVPKKIKRNGKVELQKRTEKLQDTEPCEPGFKICRKCKVKKPETDFTLQKATQTRLHACRYCRNEERKAAYRKAEATIPYWHDARRLVWALETYINQKLFSYGKTAPVSLQKWCMKHKLHHKEWNLVPLDPTQPVSTENITAVSSTAFYPLLKDWRTHQSTQRYQYMLHHQILPKQNYNPDLGPLKDCNVAIPTPCWELALLTMQRYLCSCMDVVLTNTWVAAFGADHGRIIQQHDGVHVPEYRDECGPAAPEHNGGSRPRVPDTRWDD